MGALEQINKMRMDGISDEEIVGRLQEQGVTPKAINDALNQAEIKKAVGGYGENSPQAPRPQQYAPNVQDVGEYSAPEEAPQSVGQQEYYPQEGYAESYSQGTSDTGIIMEIAEQIFSEKTQKIQKQIKEVSDFKAIAESKINSLSDRLKRIEDMMDRLQISILEKVGSYGKNIENVQNEMQMMQDSFSKVINPLADRAANKMPKDDFSELEEKIISQKSPQETKLKKTKRVSKS